MKYSKYCGSEYAPDPFFCIEKLEKQIATLTAEKDKLKEALKKLAKFRSECHAYDLDMGNPLREFGDEEWDMVEQIAQAALLCEILF